MIISRIVDTIAWTILIIGMVAVYCILCPPAHAADGPLATWQGDLLFPALVIAAACCIARCFVAISGAHAEREDADDLAALRRGRDEPSPEGFEQ